IVTFHVFQGSDSSSAGSSRSLPRTSNVSTSRQLQRKLEARIEHARRLHQEYNATSGLIPIQRLPIPGAKDHQPLVQWETDDSVQMEQRVNLKCLVKLGKTYEMLKEVYGNECLSCTQVIEWFKRFKEGRETTEDDPRPGNGPQRQKRTKTLKQLESTKNVFARFCMNRSTCAKMMAKLLTSEQKERMNICADIDPVDTVLNQLTDADFQGLHLTMEKSYGAVEEDIVNFFPLSRKESRVHQELTDTFSIEEMSISGDDEEEEDLHLVPPQTVYKRFDCCSFSLCVIM
ncbi:hypothetical protein NQ318_003903, partial [Aromia moschata]